MSHPQFHRGYFAAMRDMEAESVVLTTRGRIVWRKLRPVLTWTAIGAALALGILIGELR